MREGKLMRVYGRNLQSQHSQLNPCGNGALAFSPAGDRLAMVEETGRQLRLYNAQNGQMLKEAALFLPGDTSRLYEGDSTANHLSFSQDGKRIWLSLDGLPFCFDAGTLERLPFWVHPLPQEEEKDEHSYYASDSGRYLVQESRIDTMDKPKVRVRVFEVATGALLLDQSQYLGRRLYSTGFNADESKFYTQIRFASNVNEYTTHRLPGFVAIPSDARKEGFLGLTSLDQQGDRLLGLGEGSIRMAESGGGDLLWERPLLHEQVKSLKLGHDGAKAFLLYSNGLLSVLDAKTGQDVASFDGFSAGASISTNSRGDLMLVEDGSNLLVYSLSKQAHIATLTAESHQSLECLATAPSADRFLLRRFGSPGTQPIELWQFPNLKELVLDLRLHANHLVSSTDSHLD